MQKVKVVVSGVAGKMGKLVAQAIALEADMELHRCGLDKEVVSLDFMNRNGDPSPIRIIPAEQHAQFLAEDHENIDVIVDFTQPGVVNRNAELYCAAGIPFVMGTTGGDREMLFKTVQRSGISAVIATNFSVPVVMFQDMINHAAVDFKGALSDFKLVIWESHQATKPDPSGTASSLINAFSNLGIPFKKEQIIMVRDPITQEVELGIPQEYLGGHGYHTYTLLSLDGTVKLQFKHNVLGRNTYVDGVLRSIRFLFKRDLTMGEVFSMVDVLRG